MSENELPYELDISFLVYLYIHIFGKLGSLSETKDEKNYICSLSKNNGEVLIFSHAAGYLGPPSLPLPYPQGNKTKQMENPILLWCTEDILLFLGIKTALNTFCSLTKLNHLEIAGIFVWFLPCLVAERNILPWIRQTQSNQRCLDAAWNVIIFPLTSLTQFIVA